MIKSIIFDFDGVIVESTDIKTEAFKELFLDYSQKIKEIVSYHLINAGISRYVKFRYIYEKILREKLSDEKSLELGRCFSQIVLQKILSAPFVVGAKEFLDTHKNKYKFFIASGTPEEELREIIAARRLGKYFKGIYGSPKEKRNIIIEIMNDHKFTNLDLAYVGDAASDSIAAAQTGVLFIERKSDLDKEAYDCPWRIKNLSSLSGVLEKIEKLNYDKRRAI